MERLLMLRHFGGVAGLLLLLATGTVVSPGQILPSDAGNYAAKVMSLEGDVSMLKDGIPWALNIGDLVQVKQVIISGPDGHAIFKVSDGSTFEVFPSSTVVFRKNPPNWKDFLDVLVGRVRIHIQRWGGLPNPNRVLTPTAVISVRGTTFDVSVSDADETTLVEVEEGEVEVRHALLPSGKAKILDAGESILVYKTEPLASSVIDKSALIQRGLHSLLDALYMVLTHDPKLSGGGTPGGPLGLPGNTKPPAPPPPPPVSTPTPPPAPPPAP